MPIQPIAQQLHQTSDDKLQKWFSEHARYHAEAPKFKYTIQFGTKNLWAESTEVLFQKFLKTVREWKLPTLPHRWQNVKYRGKFVRRCQYCKHRHTEKVENDVCNERLKSLGYKVSV